MTKETCKYFLPAKARYCKFEVKPGFDHCGIHLPYVQPDAAGRTVLCPVDKTHYVREKDLAQHLLKCPANLQLQAIQAQAFFVAGCNAVSSTEAELPVPQDEGAPQSASESPSLTARRIEAARQLGQKAFLDLVARIEHAHDLECCEDEHEHVSTPAACEPFMRPDIHRPFSAKHGLQQASILGNMQDYGLLEDLERRVYIEFGAGKGYLSGMLAEAFHSQNVVLMDNKSFRQKADRGLRGIHMERWRLDIIDFDPPGLPILAQGLTPWVACGKHLCGAASDLTLRCCVRCLQNQPREPAFPITEGPGIEPWRLCPDTEETSTGSGQGPGSLGCPETPREPESLQRSLEGSARGGSSETCRGPLEVSAPRTGPGVEQDALKAHDISACDANESQPLKNPNGAVDAASANPSGLAQAATPLSTHMSDANNPQPLGSSNRGRDGAFAFPLRQGEALPSASGLDPLEACREGINQASAPVSRPQCCSSGHPGEGPAALLPASRDNDGQGRDVLPSSLAHHCCRENGCSDGDAPFTNARGGCQQGDSAGEACGSHGWQGLAIATCCHHQCQWRHYVGKEFFQRLGFTPTEFELVAWMTGWAMCGHERPAANSAAADAGDHNELEESGPSQEISVASPCAPSAVQTTGQGSDGRWEPATLLPRDHRIRIGLKCKRLIDAGRLEWLLSQGLEAESRLYVLPEVCGENRLLLARPKPMDRALFCQKCAAKGSA